MTSNSLATPSPLTKFNCRQLCEKVNFSSAPSLGLYSTSGLLFLSRKVTVFMITYPKSPLLLKQRMNHLLPNGPSKSVSVCCNVINIYSLLKSTTLFKPPSKAISSKSISILTSGLAFLEPCKLLLILIQGKCRRNQWLWSGKVHDISSISPFIFTG